MQLFLQYIQTIALTVIAVSLGILGKFLYSTFNQQLANKQSEIDTLKTQIRHLECLTAPNLADQLKKLAPLVDEYAKKVADQEKTLLEMAPASKSLAEHYYRFGVARMVLEAIGILLNTVGNTDGTQASITERIKEMTSLLASTLGQAISGKTPPLPNVEASINLISELEPHLTPLLRALPSPVDS